MKIIGITGGIASGKSTVSLYLQDKYKAYIFDADKEAKALLQSSIVKDRILQAFPNLEDFSTTSIAQEVFKNSESQAKINNIIHPIISDLILERINEKKDLHNIFVVDAALIYESGADTHMDYVIVVTSHLRLRTQRVMERGGLTREEFLDRVDLQWPDEDKVHMADFVIHNNGTKKDLLEESKKVYDRLG